MNYNRLLITLAVIWSGLTSAASMTDIYELLDFTSFPNSLNPKSIEERHFSDFQGEFKLAVPKITKDEIVIDDDHWYYKIELMEIKGDNVYLCFHDKSKVGTYDSVQPIVVRRYGNDFVALALDPTSSNQECK
ncbi:hypothetical protein J4H39_20230 [Vibrio alginolyticus]|uniref:Pesticin immunity protein n=3 Tax=Vibrio alginolyticus TaxID=663 RepID=A0ABX4X5E7_VIBAL|nr:MULTISPECIES: hypothetical protein [Vibrio]MDW1810603.1 hypothetical protein [Vibrio sp. Vb2362]AGV19810.1 hypothetical protein N646_4001 [Vibrio alginolyticus NBRC 15630 = ATCC 17749]AVF68722.1 hypothetical protein AL545_06195 [Vibrio alginolyticus]EGR1298577.1 hypothetical protein [Vibrio alginolyticus]EHA1202188.1 hypothetical protein [Vibrio alginolyticus]